MGWLILVLGIIVVILSIRVIKKTDYNKIVESYEVDEREIKKTMEENQ